MNDLEMTKLCAEAMGLFVGPRKGSPYDWENMKPYEPLYDDVQMMALARTYPLEFEMAVIEWANHIRRGEPFDLNRYFCGKVAKMWEGKK